MSGKFLMGCCSKVALTAVGLSLIGGVSCETAAAISFYREDSNDAGTFKPASIGAGKNGVAGRLLFKHNDYVDSFLFAWKGGDFRASNLSRGKVRLSLFKSESGKGLQSVNSSIGNNQGLFIGSLDAGWYRLSVSSANYIAYNSSGESIFDGGSPTGTDTVASEWKWNGNYSGWGRYYKVKLNDSTVTNEEVPEPITLFGTILAGASGIYFRRKRKSLARES